KEVPLWLQVGILPPVRDHRVPLIWPNRPLNRQILDLAPDKKDDQGNKPRHWHDWVRDCANSHGSVAASVPLWGLVKEYFVQTSRSVDDRQNDEMSQRLWVRHSHYH